MENSGLKHGFEYTASSSPVARGPGAWSREIGICYSICLYARLQAYMLKAPKLT